MCSVGAALKAHERSLAEAAASVSGTDDLQGPGPCVAASSQVTQNYHEGLVLSPYQCCPCCR